MYGLGLELTGFAINLLTPFSVTLTVHFYGIIFISMRIFIREFRLQLVADKLQLVIGFWTFSQA